MAFCRQADPDFKSLLRGPPFNTDLDEIARAAVGAAQRATPSPVSPTVPTARETQADEQASRAPAFEPAVAAIHFAEFADDAQRIMGVAAHLARRQGWNEIRSPHLFVALVGDGNGPAGRALAHTRASMADLKRIVLEVVPARGGAADATAPVTVSSNTHAVLTRAINLANAKGRTRATDLDLLEAFFADGGGVVGELLRRAGLEIRLPADGKGAGPDSIH